MARFYLKHTKFKVGEPLLANDTYPLCYAKTPGIAKRDALELIEGIEYTDNDLFVLLNEKLKPIEVIKEPSCAEQSS